ncbi:hypothetical protein cypCar_00043368 [Cyprinus carpio]|nr:hypothetical protein cypCar_00043368 [Cyprinus carpio]
MDTRVASLQRNIDFLQKQHKETLEKLHGEIDILKRENKVKKNITILKICIHHHKLNIILHCVFLCNYVVTELQYKLIMELPKSSSKG